MSEEFGDGKNNEGEEYGFDENDLEQFAEPRKGAMTNADYERAGIGGTVMQGKGMLVNIQERLDRSDPHKLFRDTVLLIGNNIINNSDIRSGLKLTRGDLEILENKISQTPNIEYKNPLGYICGYMATKGGRTMAIHDVKEIIKLLDLLNKAVVKSGGGVEPPDVVRYARFWKFNR